jgi:2-methylcitrate dehydratase PrpD
MMEYVTRELAAYLVEAELTAVPADVIHEARRALLNFVGCALGGATEDATAIALEVVSPFSGPRTSIVLGRSESLDPMHASLINGIASHVHDFDDTTPKNYSHTTSPVASALFAYASANPVSGADFLLAFILGFEAASRIGNAVYPSHYDAGWHITGTIGVIGAAVAIAKLKKLPLQNMIWAIGLGATQSAGLREMFGSMGKSFHPGRSAQSGYLAALLAEKGYTSGEYPLESPRGFAAVLSSAHDLSKVTNRLGIDFDLRDNTYKPYPCGIVIHPTIEASSLLKAEHRFEAADIESVVLRVAPIVLDLCNKKDIHLGLEGKFSIFHAAALGLVRGKAGLDEFSDETVNDPLIRQVRSRVTAIADKTIADESSHVEVTLRNGRKLTKFVKHSLGNINNALSDRHLEEKFSDQARRVLKQSDIDALIKLCWKIDELPSLSEINRLAGGIKA